jgi:DNA-binding NarL/FixJ family response regulator
LSSAIDALRLGADDYMLKPCDTDELELRIARCLEKINLLAELKKQNRLLSKEIRARKEAEKALATINRELETRVKIRTAELEETNIALNVLLKKNEQNKREIEEQVIGNVRELIEPVLNKLKKSGIDDHQRMYADILTANLNKIISPFLANVTAKTLKFTPMEIQVASLIRLGRTSKEISMFLSISPATVDVHRKNIRKKVGITNQKVNLRTVLANVS